MVLHKVFKPSVCNAICLSVFASDTSPLVLLDNHTGDRWPSIYSVGDRFNCSIVVIKE